MSKSVAKIKTTSKDIFADELKKFSQIFPQFISEGKVDFDALQAFLADKDALADEKDKYTFTWAGKKQSFQAISRPSHATLNPKIDESVDFDNTQNLFIEGDNLEVLKLLQKHYHSKIKMIYIDPPYNTGKDFIYKDNFTEGKSDYFERIGATENGIQLESNSDAGGRYHSQWLSMMYPRLFLAKQLLKDDGVIFISIDDNEQHHLKMLMNEVFGEGNFICEFTWQRKYNASNDSNTVSNTHEYIYLYGKEIDNWRPILLPRTEKQLKAYSNEDNDSRGDWRISDLSAARYTPKDVYEIISPTGKTFLPPKGRSWVITKEKYEKLLQDNRIVFGKNGNSRPMQKKFLSEVRQGITPNTWLKRELVGDNKTARYEFKDIFPENIFDNPKPSTLIRFFIKMSTKNEDTILDFFSGSATTGHAMMDLNKSDNGGRKFILVQIPEAIKEQSEAFKAGYKNISEIGKERLRRAIKKYKLKAGFKVFSLAPTNYNIANSYDGDDTKTLLELEKLSTKKPLIDNFDSINLVYEIILKQGFSLNAKIEHKDDFYLIKDNELDRKLAITLQNPINTKQIEDLKLTTDDILVCLDKSLTDTQKVNFLRNFNLRVI